MTAKAKLSEADVCKNRCFPSVGVAKPNVLVYVVPGTFDEDFYRAALDVLDEVAKGIPVFILEFQKIKLLDKEIAASELSNAIRLARRKGRLEILFRGSTAPARGR